MADSWDAWLASRKATNQLLGFMIVVLAAGFVSVDGGYGGLQIVAELLLMLILIGAIVLFLAALLGVDS